MKIDLTLKDGTRFVVNLDLDLKPYCEAYTALDYSRKHLAQLKEARKEDSSPVNDKDIEIAENELNNALAAFSLLREDHLEHLTLLPGEMVWWRIKNLLKTQCRLADPVEQELYSALSKGGADGSLPLVIECLNMSFIELLKNSIDAVLINYLKDSSTNIFLQMELSLSVEDSIISIVIKDNAGGFL